MGKNLGGFLFLFLKRFLAAVDGVFVAALLAQMFATERVPQSGLGWPQGRAPLTGLGEKPGASASSVAGIRRGSLTMLGAKKWDGAREP
jgi:hypothetical protein